MVVDGLGRRPITPLRNNLSALARRVGAGCDFTQTMKKRVRIFLVERLVTVDEVAPKMVVVDREPVAEQSSDKLDLRGKIDAVRGRHIIKRFFAEPVARQRQPAARLVINGKGPHAFALVQNVPAEPPRSEERRV